MRDRRSRVPFRTGRRQLLGVSKPKGQLLLLQPSLYVTVDEVSGMRTGPHYPFFPSGGGGALGPPKIQQQT